MQFRDLPEDFQDLLNPLFGPDSRFSLVELLPDTLSGRLLDLITQAPDLIPLLANEELLRDRLKDEYKCQPTATEERVRMCFWLEFESACFENRPMIVQNIHSLVCDARTFYRLFATKPQLVAFFLCKPLPYQKQVEEMLSHGMRTMRRILDMPEYDGKGKLNLKLLELKTKITAMADMRLHGAPKQSIQQLNVNIDAQKPGAAKDVKTLVQKGDMDTIRKRLHEIEQQTRKLEGAPEPLPVTIEVEK